jgi:hypothetical protein
LVWFSQGGTTITIGDREALSAESRGAVMDFQYDEFAEIVLDGRATYAQSIVFGNGWELTLRFTDVQVTLAQPIFPLAGTVLVPVSEAGAAQSA